ncbi:cohesin domain-containing protein [Geotalea sp. SG265]|uniref:cohesin domain-containing protein n=1 Tax=Geotalea sp. SG265 TaxID=2922867 RepID=UPI001FAF30BD|nr:cohesin domain-containing protein [Geotalea sp. SG265]
MKRLYFAVMIALNLCFAASAFATANVVIPPSVDGKSWTLQAKDFDNIAGAELTISYDPAILGSPTVTQGSFLAGSMLVPNTNTPGVVRIGVVTTKPLSGSGPLATVTFQRKTSGFGKIKLAARLVNNDLAPAPVIPIVPSEDGTEPPDKPGNSGGSSGDKSSQQTQSGGQSQNTGSSTVVLGGNVTLPPDLSGSAEEKKTPQATPDYREEQRHESPSVGRETAASEGKRQEPTEAPAVKIEPTESILGRFKGYKGEMTSKAFIDLFTVDAKAPVKQDPPILLADGKANLSLTVPNPQGKQAPNFALKKARLVSLKVAPNGSWIVVAKPDKGAYDASVTMLVDDSAVEMPLTVAPKVDIDLDRSGKVDENDFAIFLRDRGTEKAPKHDLNKDGRRDYIDDYIFTANFLVLHPKAALNTSDEKRKPEGQSAAKPKGK